MERPSKHSKSVSELPSRIVPKAKIERRKKGERVPRVTLRIVSFFPPATQEKAGKDAGHFRGALTLVRGERHSRNPEDTPPFLGTWALSRMVHRPQRPSASRAENGLSTPSCGNDSTF